MSPSPFKGRDRGVVISLPYIIQVALIPWSPSPDLGEGWGGVPIQSHEHCTTPSPQTKQPSINCGYPPTHSHTFMLCEYREPCCPHTTFFAILNASYVFRGSTTVVQLPVKELVVGSNPTRGASERSETLSASKATACLAR